MYINYLPYVSGQRPLKGTFVHWTCTFHYLSGSEGGGAKMFPLKVTFVYCIGTFHYLSISDLCIYNVHDKLLYMYYSQINLF